MLRQLTVIGCMLAAGLASAEEAGKVIFVTGAAQVADKAVALNAPVQEGDTLHTGADGYIYVRTVDNGLFILRPNTTARIAAYHVDKANPANTRVKLELVSGVARSRSGEAVKLARQNFRFNTPVAAIGVRGTDFTVFTDQNTSRVAVLSGAIVMTGFDGACRAEGTGPCEGRASRELSASQRGQLLQIQRGQDAPQLLTGGVLSSDPGAAARPDEPLTKSGASTDVNLDAQKSASLTSVAGKPAPVVAPVAPPVVTPAPVIENQVPDPQAGQPVRGIVWGRFQSVAGQDVIVSLGDQRALGNERVGLKGPFALYLTSGHDYVPEHGSVGFGLLASEAYVYSDVAGSEPFAAVLQNGQLTVNFDQSTFATSFDLQAGTDTFHLKSGGTVANGHLYGKDQYVLPFVNVDGVLSNAKGGTAAYLFQGRLDASRTAAGATYWGH